MSSCGPQISRSQTSHTYLSYAEQELYGTDPLEVPSCNHWRFCEKASHRSQVEADTLGSPVGLVCSSATLGNPVQEEEANARNFAIYLKAFALIYVLPEVDWTAEKIDMLLAEGSDLFQASSEMDQSEDEAQGENKILQPKIYTKEEKRIKRNFRLEGHTFTLGLEPRYLGEVARPTEQPPRHIIKNLKRILQAFFKSSRYCLLLTRVGHLLIWRRKKVFFVLDVKGRRRDDLQSDKDNGVAMLVCLKTIDNVVHLASNLSGIEPNDEFTIRELVVVRLETPDGRIYLRDSSYRSVEFKVVNKSYAYLKATLHLSLTEVDTVKNRSSLMVAVGAILASKIDHPANWDTNMLDRLISYGVELCRSCWADCLRDRRPIDLETFPTQLRMGQFVLELKLIPNVRTGFWKCGVSIVGTDFEARLWDTFRRYGNVVFQMNNQMYAMWAKDDFYYLLDPYRHSVVGSHVAADQAKDAKWATVRMFRDQLTMLSVFHQLLKESNRQSTYYLHVVRIRNLAECPKGFVLAPLPADSDTFDVESLNETIMFGDQLGPRVCNHFLAENTDCEVDVVSEKEDKLDVEKIQILDQRQIAGAAEAEMCEEEAEANTRSLCKKHLIPKQETSKSKTKSLKKRKIISRKSTTEGQNLAKKEKESSKGFKAKNITDVAIQEPKNTPRQSSLRRMKRKPVSTRKAPVSRQPGGSVSAQSPASSTELSSPGRLPKDKWSAEESTIIKLGPKVAATNLRDLSTKATNPRILPSRRPSPLEVDSIGQPETISPQTSFKDILQQSMDKSIHGSTDPSRKGTNPRILPSRRPSPLEVDSIGQLETISPQTAFKDILQQSMDKSIHESTDPSRKATNPRILPSRRPSPLEVDAIGQPETISPQTALKDILQQSMDKSNLLGVAAVANTHFTTPIPSGLDHQAEGSPIQKTYMQKAKALDNKELHEERSESLPRFPGFNQVPQLLAVAGSESGTMESLNRLLGSAFKVANRVLTMTPWGNYVVFRHRPKGGSRSSASWFYLFDGCTCDIDRFRHLDLSTGTAGLVAFRKLSEVVCHMIDSREQRALKMLTSRAKENSPLIAHRSAESIRVV